jgi:hypothetical protein
MEDREAEPTPAPGAGSRARLVFAGATAAALAAVVLVIVLAGGGTSVPEPPAPPPECVEDWNADEAAVAYGRHNSVSHSYLDVQVTRLTERGTEPEDPDDGLCAVIFARGTLDPEPGAAAQIRRPEGGWEPLSDQRGVEEGSLAELQAEAVTLANADLETDGTITIP